MVKPRRAALVFLVLAALLAVAWVSRARWLAALPAALGANAALITIIVAILGLLVAAGAAVVQWSGQRRPRPSHPAASFSRSPWTPCAPSFGTSRSRPLPTWTAARSTAS